jgi:RES domain-containing protein
MLTGDELSAALAGLPVLSESGVAYRIVHAKYAASTLSSIGSLKFGGRYNPPQAFEALYLASNPVTALQEVNAVVQTEDGLLGVKGPPRILLSVDYQLQAILDICHPENQSVLETNLSELIAPWRPLNAKGQMAPTQTLGSAAYNLQSIEALKVPSARDPNTYNLVVFVNRLSDNSSLRVYDDSGIIDARLP